MLLFSRICFRAHLVGTYLRASGGSFLRPESLGFCEYCEAGVPAVCGLNAEAGDNWVCLLRQVSGPDEVQASSWASAEDDFPDVVRQSRAVASAD